MKNITIKAITAVIVFVLAVSLVPALAQDSLPVAENVPALAQDSRVSEDLIEKIEAVIDQDTSRLQEIFKDIHANPELGFMEERTSAIVAQELQGLGYDVQTGIGQTGVVGILKNGAGPTFMYRADMDANAVEEETGLPYASTVRVTNLDGIETPVAHLCGHDAHTTWLISLAKTMKDLKDEWSGTLVLLAQPAEEPIEGAKAMLEDGLYTRHGVPKPDYFLTLHTAPLPTGAVISTSGRLNTGSEHIDVTFNGVGGHGSAPHVAKDPVIMAGLAITQYQTIVSRRIDPTETGILTVGSVQAGVDNNVIPTEAILKLKLHFSTPEVQEQLVRAIELVSNGIAQSFEVPEDLMPSFLHKGYTPAMVNTDAYITRIEEALAKTDFVDQVFTDYEVTGSDDAAALIEGIEGVQAAYLMVGTAEPELVAAAQARGDIFPFANHEPTFQVDLEAIPYGAKVAALLALDVLSQ